MMKKTLLAAGLATALTVSTGLAVASAQVAIDDTPTAMVEQDRDQVRDCDLYNGDAVADQDRNQVRDRDRDCELCTDDAVQLQNREREQVGVDGMTGVVAGRANGSSGVGNGQGVLDGTGPLHDGLEDGIGNQFGSAAH